MERKRPRFTSKEGSPQPIALPQLIPVQGFGSGASLVHSQHKFLQLMGITDNGTKVRKCYR